MHYKKPRVTFYGADVKGRTRTATIDLESGEWINPAAWADLCKRLGGTFPSTPYAIRVSDEYTDKTYDVKAYSKVKGVDTLNSTEHAGIRCKVQKSVDGKIKMCYQIKWR